MRWRSGSVSREFRGCAGVEPLAQPLLSRMVKSVLSWTQMVGGDDRPPWAEAAFRPTPVKEVIRRESEPRQARHEQGEAGAEVRHGFLDEGLHEGQAAQGRGPEISRRSAAVGASQR